LLGTILRLKRLKKHVLTVLSSLEGVARDTTFWGELTVDAISQLSCNLNREILLGLSLPAIWMNLSDEDIRGGKDK